MRKFEEFRYMKIIDYLKAINKEGATWSQIKRYLEIRLGIKIYDSQLARLLRNLINNGFIDKRDNICIIPDPILRHTTGNITC